MNCALWENKKAHTVPCERRRLSPWILSSRSRKLLSSAAIYGYWGPAVSFIVSVLQELLMRRHTWVLKRTFLKTVPENLARSPVSPRGLLDAAFIWKRIYGDRFAATGRHFQTLPHKIFFTFLRASRKVSFAMKDMQKRLEGERQKSSTNCFLLDWNPELILSEGVKSQRCPPTQGKANLCTNAAVR